MINNVIWTKFNGIQDDLYKKLNSYDEKSAGRFSVLISFADVILDTLKRPLCSIEYLAWTVQNLALMAFDAKYTFKDALRCLESSLVAAAATPVVVVLAPIKLIYLLFVNAVDPKNAIPFYKSRA